MNIRKVSFVKNFDRDGNIEMKFFEEVKK